MMKIYVNGSDVTSSVEFGTVQITEQLNNRRNTARFKMFGASIDEAQIVKIFKGTTILAVSAGASTVTVDDSFQTSGFFAV